MNIREGYGSSFSYQTISRIDLTASYNRLNGRYMREMNAGSLLSQSAGLAVAPPGPSLGPDFRLCRALNVLGLLLTTPHRFRYTQPVLLVLTSSSAPFLERMKGACLCDK